MEFGQTFVIINLVHLGQILVGVNLVEFDRGRFNQIWPKF